jgi:voltage-gated potassium channel
MAVLAVCYLALAFLTDESRGPSLAALLVLAVIFLAEFTVRFADAPSRGLYFRRHWIDLVSCIPLVGGLRGLRLLRLLRLGAVARVFSMATREADEHGVQRESWWFLAPLLIVVWLGAAVVYFHFEHGSNSNVNNLGDAIYWSFITTTTVGYGDVRPVTSEGRVIAGLLVFVGIGLVGVVSAQLTSRLLRTGDQGQDARMRRMERHLEELATAVSDLRDIVAMNLQTGLSAGQDLSARSSEREKTSIPD